MRQLSRLNFFPVKGPVLLSDHKEAEKEEKEGAHEDRGRGDGQGEDIDG